MVGPRLKIFPMNYYAAVAGSLRVSVACKAVLAGDFIPFLLGISMPKRFADRDQTKCSSQRRQLQTWADCAQKLWQASSLEGNLFMIRHLERIFMLSRASHRLKKGPRSGTCQRYLFEKYFPK